MLLGFPKKLFSPSAISLGLLIDFPLIFSCDIAHGELLVVSMDLIPYYVFFISFLLSSRYNKHVINSLLILFLKRL